MSGSETCDEGEHCLVFFAPKRVDADMNAQQKAEYDRRQRRSERLQKAIAKGDVMLRWTDGANNKRMRELSGTGCQL